MACSKEKGGESVPVAMPVHWPGERRVYVGGCADEQEHDEEEGVEVEESRVERRGRHISFVFAEDGGGFVRWSRGYEVDGKACHM